MILANCKEVATAFARGEYDSASALTRASIHIHLLICRRCRRFKRQLQLIETALRSAVFAEPDPAASAALQRAVLKRLGL